jgi:DNA-binding XRE family transcriptional regulator
VAGWVSKWLVRIETYSPKGNGLFCYSWAAMVFWKAELITSKLMLTQNGIYCTTLSPIMKPRTNFDIYLEQQLKDPDFAGRFKKAGEAWDVALKLASLRKASGLSQKELAKRVGTSQQQISRLESPSYEGHSLSMLRRVAEVLGASVHVEIKQRNHRTTPVVAEPKATYRVKRKAYEEKE